MRLLICGSRDWTDWLMIFEHVVAVPPKDVDLIIHGAARGADQCAGRVGRRLNIPVAEFPAQWNTYGKRAGPIRNQQMIDEGHPDLVYAFKDGFDLTHLKGAGTEDMIRRSIEAGIRWKSFSHYS